MPGCKVEPAYEKCPICNVELSQPLGSHDQKDTQTFQQFALFYYFMHEEYCSMQNKVLVKVIKLVVLEVRLSLCQNIYIYYSKLI